MPKKEDRVILDTNLWISFLLTSDYTKLDTIFEDKLITLVFSQELLDEFITVSQRPKFRKYFSLSDLQDLILKVRERAVFIEVQSVIAVCRDHKDNFLLALAKDSKATHLITGDKDLLDIRVFEKTKILTIADYLESK
jgi:uncharacterized protein